jgi:hypothetical protein
MSKIEQSIKNEHSIADERWNEILKQAVMHITGEYEPKRDLLSSDILFEKSVNQPGGKIILGVITRGDLKKLRDEYSSKNKSANLEESVEFMKHSIESLLKQQSDQIASISTKIEELKSPINLSNDTHITVKQFAEKYKISDDSQRALRTRRKDPLPYIQLSEGGNVTYNIKIVDKWYENYLITHKRKGK